MDLPDKDQVWHECLESLKVSVSSAIFSTWFSKTRLTSLTLNQDRFRAEIGCASAYVKNTIELRYFGLVQDSLTKTLGKACDLVFVISEDETIKNPTGELSPLFAENPNQNEVVLQRVISSSRLRTDFTFDNFAVSASNQMAWAAAQAVAREPGKAYNPLFLWGGVGVGKTHLMSAVGLDVLNRDPEKKVYLCTGEDFTNDIVEGIKKKSTQEVRGKYRKLHLLMVDDIQFIAGKDTVQEEFFHTFNAIVSVGGQVIMTSDRPPQEIAKLEERLQSRFEAGLIVDIAKPDFELRCAIVEIKAKEKGLTLPTEVVHLIAGNVESPRKILGVLTRISTEILVKHLNTITEETVMSILKKNQEGNGQAQKKIEPQAVIEATCHYFNLGKRSIMGESRIQKLALPRQILMYLLRVELGIQLTEVGRLVGRDHTTVMHAVDKITALASANVQIREDITGIKKSLWG